jgi:hypothetical protein
VGIGKCLAVNCMCAVWVTRSRSLGWYSGLRNVAVIVFLLGWYAVERGCLYRC